MAAQIDHPAAMRVLELGLDHDPPYVVMEWVGTTTLAASVKATGPKSRNEAIELVHAVAGALRAAHRLGLSHGRIGPADVLVGGATTAEARLHRRRGRFPG